MPAIAAVGLKLRRCSSPCRLRRPLFPRAGGGGQGGEAGDFDVILVCRLLAGARCPRTSSARSRPPSLPAGVVVLSRNAHGRSRRGGDEGGGGRLPRTSPARRRSCRRSSSGSERPCAGHVASGRRGNATPNRPHGFEGMLGQCPAMREVFALIERIAPTDSTVLVTGESGTGKEMVVRAIHRLSRRRDYPLLACDCTALAPTLLESELFGHVKGSFSGAIATKKGLFEVAHQGTLLSRRSGQPEPGDARQAAARAGDAAGPQGGRHGGARGRHPADRHHQPQPGRDGQGRRVSRRSLLPAERRADLAFPPCANGSATFPCWPTVFLRQFSRQMGVEAGGFSREAMRQMEVYRLAGQRPRTAEHRRASGRALRRLADRAVPSAVGDPARPRPTASAAEARLAPGTSSSG